MQIGRFVAGLSDVSNACELAHADCSPKPCGNGVLTITDWVQAGRYAAGLDPLVLMTDCPPPALAAGPNSKSKPQNLDVPRKLYFTNATMARGTTNCLSVMLASQGDENALGFSIHFDTNLITYVRNTRGADALGATLFQVNTLDLAQGLIGVTIGLNQDESFPAGARTLVNLCFRAKAGSNTVTTPLTFGDSPVALEVSDPNANALAVDPRPGTVTLVSDRDFLFHQLTRAAGGEVSLLMMGPAGVWELQRSTNLTNWLPMQRLTNTSGQMNFMDATATNAAQRFYRAVKQ